MWFILIVAAIAIGILGNLVDFFDKLINNIVYGRWREVLKTALSLAIAYIVFQIVFQFTLKWLN